MLCVITYPSKKFKKLGFSSKVSFETEAPIGEKKVLVIANVAGQPPQSRNAV